MTAIRVSTYAGPGCDPVIHSVPWPKVPDCGALIRIEACGVCGTDLHILAGHWPKPLPWPLTLGHELVGVIEEKGAALETDFMGHSLALGASRPTGIASAPSTSHSSEAGPSLPTTSRSAST